MLPFCYLHSTSCSFLFNFFASPPLDLIPLDYEKRGWLCRTFNQKGKTHCDAKQIPEEILKRVSAEAMGLPEFDEAAFAAKVEEIQVPENGVLVFVFYDGHTVTKTWDNPSRRHSWNPENRQRARELALRQAAERRLAKCQQ